MSILDNGPHTVIVTPMVTTRGSLGSKTVPGEPVTLTGVAVQAVTTRGEDAGEARVDVTYRVIGRGCWPGGHKSIVEVVDGPRLGLFDQEGEAAMAGMSARVQHFDVAIRARTSEVR